MNKRLEFTLDMREKHPEKPFIHPSVEIPDWVKVGRNVSMDIGVKFTRGFGFERDESGRWLHIPHIGGADIGDDVEIFADTIINRGTIDDTVIGNRTKIDHQCLIGHNSQIGEDCLITAGTVIAGSAHIGNSVWIGPHSTILNKVRIANNVYVGGHSNIIYDIDEENVLVYGNPAKIYKADQLPYLKMFGKFTGWS